MPEPRRRLVEIVFEEPRWRSAGLSRIAERAARAALAETGRDPEGFEISLLACDDARIAALNAAFRGRPAPTNVLSWPAATGPGAPPDAPGSVALGDAALAFETCAAEAEAAGVTLGDHAAHLVAHAVLHLLGHDHEETAEAEAMEALETKILARLGVANPYGLQERPSGAGFGQET